MAFSQGDYRDRLESLGLRLLSVILFSMESSPVKTMLQTAGLVHDVFAQYEDSFLQPMMVIGCHGLERDDAEFISEAIMFELERLAEEGIDPEVVQAGINQWKFRLREGFQEGTASKGITLGIDVLAQLGRGIDPLLQLDYDGLTKELEAKLSEGFLEDLIRRYFVENPHRVDLLLWPDDKLAARQDAAWTKRLEDIKQGLSDEEVRKAKRFQASLSERQLTPDDPAKLSAMPRLDVADLSPAIEATDLERIEAPFEMYQLATRAKGINYLSLMIGLDDPGETEYATLGILSALLTNLATTNRSHQQLNSDIMKLTGGLQASPQVFHRAGETSVWLQLNLNFLDEYRLEDLELLFDVLENTRFEDVSQIENVLFQAQTGFESFVLSRGDIVSAELSAAQFDPAAGYLQQINGAPVYQMLKELTKDQAKIKAMLPRLEELFNAFRGRDRVRLFYQGDRAETIAQEIAGRFEDWPIKGETKKLPAWSAEANRRAYTIPSAVAFTAKGLDYRSVGGRYSGQLLSAKQLIDTDYLWEKVRVLGEAYGSALQLDPGGALVCTSYRDPKPVESLSVYQGIADYLD